jgi:hypothetical protein
MSMIKAHSLTQRKAVLKIAAINQTVSGG